MAQHPLLGLTAAVSASVLAHGIAYASLAYAPSPPRAAPPSHVSFRVQAAPVPAPSTPASPPPQAAPPAPPPRTRTNPAPALETRAAAPPARAPAPAAPQPAAVDLRGITLTNDSGSAAWSSATGNGNDFNGPVGPIGNTAPRALPATSAHPLAPAAEAGLVAASDLSARPVPPELTGALRERYPLAAKQRGLGGSASVQARIEPDGRVRQVSVQAESFAGFGDACKKTLLASRWSPPRDKDGRAVATLVRYTCRFVVQP